MKDFDWYGLKWERSYFNKHHSTNLLVHFLDCLLSIKTTWNKLSEPYLWILKGCGDNIFTQLQHLTTIYIVPCHSLSCSITILNTRMWVVACIRASLQLVLLEASIFGQDIHHNPSFFIFATYQIPTYNKKPKSMSSGFYVILLWISPSIRITHLSNPSSLREILFDKPHQSWSLHIPP